MDCRPIANDLRVMILNVLFYFILLTVITVNPTFRVANKVVLLLLLLLTETNRIAKAQKSVLLAKQYFTLQAAPQPARHTPAPSVDGCYRPEFD